MCRYLNSARFDSNTKPENKIVIAVRLRQQSKWPAGQNHQIPRRLDYFSRTFIAGLVQTGVLTTFLKTESLPIKLRLIGL